MGFKLVLSHAIEQTLKKNNRRQMTIHVKQEINILTPAYLILHIKLMVHTTYILGLNCALILL